MPRIVRGNHQQPHGSLIITSNLGIGETNPATKSRIIPLYIQPATNGDRFTLPELIEAQRTVSGCFPALLKLGYPREQVKALEKELLRYLPKAHDRTALHLALVTYYAAALARLAELDVDPKAWVIQQLCPYLNGSHSGLDSVSDFLSKLRALETDNLVGKWNKIRVQTKEQGDCIALYLPSIWQVTEQRFKPAYNQAALERSLLAKGAIKNKAQKFWETRDETLAYHRAKRQGHNEGDNWQPPLPPKRVNRKALLIPFGIWQGFCPGWTQESDDQSDLGEPDSDPEPVTPVTLSNLDLVTAQNSDSEGISVRQTIASNQVTIKEEEEEEGSPTNNSSHDEALAHSEAIKSSDAFPEKLVTVVTAVGSQPQSQSRHGLEQLPELGYSLVTQVKAVTGLTTDAVQADHCWLPQLGDRVSTLIEKHWQVGTLTSIPRIDTTLRQNQSYWKVRLDGGDERYIWEVGELKPLEAKASLSS